MTDTLEHVLRKFNLDPKANYHKVGLPLGLTMNRRQFAELLAELNFAEGAEIGTARGIYAETLCRSNPKMHLICVDPWLTYEGYRDYQLQSTMNELEEEGRKRLEGQRVSFLKMYSNEAAPLIQSERLDFVYIDANHSYEYVVQDIAAWLPKIRPGGIIGGHDYSHPKGKGFGVIEAVEGWTKAYHVAPWFIFKGERERDGDRCHSWFWVKE